MTRANGTYLVGAEIAKVSVRLEREEIRHGSAAPSVDLPLGAA